VTTTPSITAAGIGDMLKSTPARSSPAPILTYSAAVNSGVPGK
jgi:hypothetical protein